MKILAIETYCDETAICILQTTETPNGVDFLVPANVTNSQIELHRPFGGVFPALAKREHQKNLPIVLAQVLNVSVQEIETLSNPGFDAICVTSGPGLEPALWTGILFAKTLGAQWNIPVVPVNHMEGHILSVLMPEQPSDTVFHVDLSRVQFPALALLISGGHTELVLVNAIGDYQLIGKTVDDAVGEAFDKVARILGLPYPGGPEISKLAELAVPSISASEQNVDHPVFPRPMIHSPNLDFSFSGLKTAVLYYSQSLPQPLSQEHKIAISYEFQNAVSEVLVRKTKKAIEAYGSQTLIIGGGVSANNHIKSELQKMIAKDFPGMEIMTPTRELSTDNAVMIALAGYFKIKKNPNVDYGDIKADGNWSL